MTDPKCEDVKEWPQISIPIYWNILVSDADIDRGFIDVDFNGNDVRVFLEEKSHD